MTEVWEQQWQQGARGLHRNAERLALRPMRRGLPNRVPPCLRCQLSFPTLRISTTSRSRKQVNQLEAAALDSELIDMLLDQV